MPLIMDSVLPTWTSYYTNLELSTSKYTRPIRQNFGKNLTNSKASVVFSIVIIFTLEVSRPGSKYWNRPKLANIITYIDKSNTSINYL